MSTLSYHFPEFATSPVVVPSGRGAARISDGSIPHPTDTRCFQDLGACAAEVVAPECWCRAIEYPAGWHG